MLLFEYRQLVYVCSPAYKADYMAEQSALIGLFPSFVLWRRGMGDLKLLRNILPRDIRLCGELMVRTYY